MKTTKGDDDDFEICLQDMQWLQGLVQHLHSARQYLANNAETIDRLRDFGVSLVYGDSRPTRPEKGTAKLLEELSNWVRLWKDETNSVRSELDVFIKQVQGCIDLVRPSYQSYD